MAEIKGEVAFINERTGTSKKPPYRPYTAYSIKLRLADGNLSEGLNAGFKKPEVSQGDFVSATVEQGANGYFDIKAIEKVAKPVAAAPAVSAGAAPAANEESNGTADRQTQIVLQHSQEMAIAEVDLLIRNGALPLSAATNKSGVTKRYAEITAAVEKLTVQRFFDVVTARLLDTVADAGEVDVAADAPVPAAAEAQPEADE